MPFPVWKIQFLLFKINFENLETNEEHFVIEVFGSKAFKQKKVGKIMPFSDWIVPFPVLKISF